MLLKKSKFLIPTIKQDPNKQLNTLKMRTYKRYTKQKSTIDLAHIKLTKILPFSYLNIQNQSENSESIIEEDLNSFRRQSESL